jgi:hypothetical protein
VDHIWFPDLKSIVELVVLPTVQHCLAERATHGDMIGEVNGKPPIKFSVLCLQMRRQTTVLRRKVIVFFLVHLFIDHVGFCHA